jgi:hypothetical protein
MAISGATAFRTPFVRAHRAHACGDSGAWDGKESIEGLRGKVAVRFFPLRCLESARMPLRKAFHCTSCLIARRSVTQKPTRLVISWCRRNRW